MSPENFEDAGYEVPQTMEELKALTDQIVADGGTPWCIGLGSGGATGWPATDWVEDMMLRTQSPESTTSGSRTRSRSTIPPLSARSTPSAGSPRTTPSSMAARRGVASTDFRDSPKGLFSSPPKCYMHRQASFIPSFFPEGTKVGEDADFFYFPPMRARISASRCWAPARWPSSPRTLEGRARLHRIPEMPDRA
jgi:alpha-glucoside transport system substrate-binding protein